MALKRTYDLPIHEGPTRRIDIFQYNERNEVEVVTTLRAENLPDALTKFYRRHLESQGWWKPSRTGNVLTVSDFWGQDHEFVARDSIA